jgi:hypothetical protein
MAFSVKKWVDEKWPFGPSADVAKETPIDGASLEDLERRVTDYADSSMADKASKGELNSKTLESLADYDTAPILVDQVTIDVNRRYGVAPGENALPAVKEALAWALAEGFRNVKIYFSRTGIYLWQGEVQEGEAFGYHYAGQLLLPARKESEGRLTIEIAGCSTVRRPWFQHAEGGSSEPTEDSGGVVFLTNATTGYMIDVKPAFKFVNGSEESPFSNLLLKTEKVIFRAPENPKCGGINAFAALGARLDETLFEPNPTNVGGETVPTGTRPALILPGNYNNGQIEARNVCIYGWGEALRHYEHAVLANVQIARCGVALSPRGGSAKHLSHYQYVNAEVCPITIFAPKPAEDLATEQGAVLSGVLDIEAGGGAFAPVFVIKDEGNLLLGSLILGEESSRSGMGFPVAGARNLDWSNPFRGSGRGWKDQFPFDNFKRDTYSSDWLGTCTFTGNPWQKSTAGILVEEVGAAGHARSALAEGPSAALVRYRNLLTTGSRRVIGKLTTRPSGKYKAQIRMGVVIAGANEGNYLYVQISEGKFKLFRHTAAEATVLAEGGTAVMSMTYAVQIDLTCPALGGPPNVAKVYVNGALAVEHELSAESKEKLTDTYTASPDVQDGIGFVNDNESYFTEFRVLPLFV